MGVIQNLRFSLLQNKNQDAVVPLNMWWSGRTLLLKQCKRCDFEVRSKPFRRCYSLAISDDEDDEDADDSNELSQNGRGRLNKDKQRKRSKSRSITPPPPLAQHQLEGARLVVRYDLLNNCDLASFHITPLLDNILKYPKKIIPLITMNSTMMLVTYQDLHLS